VGQPVSGALAGADGAKGADVTEVTYYARGDSSSANNASLNAQGTSTTPTAELTFTNLDSPTNDILLDFNGGQPDPDTWVIVDGVTYSFTVEMSGYLPTSQKLSNVNGEDLRGDPVTVITLSNGQRYFFMADQQLSLATMDAFPNGAHALTGVVTSGPPVLICFASGTLIDTPRGPRAVEGLRPGDLVQTGEGRAVPILWRGDRMVSLFEAMRHPSARAVVIPSGAFGPGLPRRELRLSPSHRLTFGGWQAELLFGEERVLVPAEHLVGLAGIHRAPPRAAQGFHHILCAAHETVLAEGVEAETFQPGARALYGRSEADLAALVAALPPGAEARRDCARSLRRGESLALMARLLPVAWKGARLALAA
jgi:hypothetical protein